MSPRFAGKVVVVTGAAQGIGRRVAERAAAEGARLVLVDRAEHIVELEQALAPAEAATLVADLEDYAENLRAMAFAHARMGRIDVLVNNVGGTIWAKPYAAYAPDQIEAEVRRSLFPALWGCRAVLPYLIEQGGGAIVNVSSIATRSIHRVPYGAAKGGVNALTACLAFEYAGQGIRVNAVAPGGTDAPPRRVPRNAEPQSAQEQAWYQDIVAQTLDSSLMKRYGTLDEQAAAILFLASDEASYITGTVLPVGGGDQG
ncbi:MULTISPECIES: 1,6-dihydroxycyclohexa-2,4-diene-1-carboxylate dehydrogenase [unclassified Xanthomonas]|uniref:1,6-dihydroxycyclohexa-2,4-diene-1-carboxylate dehydrogenase n=1 Tax=unclassified Xanthomonas TaxID=2643310 RepID=UPI00161F6C70|nr:MULTISPECIES: 1,6-dihydroxycyclohexa-2,4-diene-1-carboxylate dehydrogenase [unclassified Xanthomonas]MBB5878768.1 dihydroxycyclohexadiene carboxylate dehydrogenase [Xanthomonas sp. 3498]MBB5941764.1 dihydroxycyclohexadiene carboxylate dehydrogenase [Xanthomonas sp. 3307]